MPSLNLMLLSDRYHTLYIQVVHSYQLLQIHARNPDIHNPKCASYAPFGSGKARGSGRNPSGRSLSNVKPGNSLRMFLRIS